MSEAEDNYGDLLKICSKPTVLSFASSGTATNLPAHRLAAKFQFVSHRI